MSNFAKTLKFLKEKSNNTTQQGEHFERLMCNFFKEDSTYKTHFKNVWLWKDYPKRTGADTGVDIVAESNDGNIYGIQCKFYSEDYELKKSNIDSFFNELGKTNYTKGIIVSTTNNWSSNAEKSLSNRQKDCQRIDRSHLESSDVNWETLSKKNKTKPRRKTARTHQKKAIQQVLTGFKKHDKGKLIMPCGTGKTFTSLKIADKFVQNKGNILFLVPSLSLLSQTLREWTQNTDRNINCFVVCSDSQVGKNTKEEDIAATDLAIAATTDANKLVSALQKTYNNTRNKKNVMNVIFSTYHSIKVISDAQKKHSLKDFDLIICDEAHRTTGVEGGSENLKNSYFTKVHDEQFIKSKKRLYMTATPRIYSEGSKTKAKENDLTIYSMDDSKKYGNEFYRLEFSDAIEKKLLSDYKVSVLVINEQHVQNIMKNSFMNNDEINTSDVVKIIGCWNTLSGKFNNKKNKDIKPMKRAVAFSGTIQASKHIRDSFTKIINAYIKEFPNKKDILTCKVHHVDGTQNSLKRNEELSWLKGDNNPIPEGECRILTNARCLSEGVDVPSLDAVLFLSPKKSEVDIVQSVGRVMRKAEGKNFGHIILPVVISSDTSIEQALNNNSTFKIVWQVLQALRSHDNRFDSIINKIECNTKSSKNIDIIGIDRQEDENLDEEDQNNLEEEFRQIDLPLPIDKLKEIIYAKIVVKCGNRQYLDILAKDISRISDTLTCRIRKSLEETKIKLEFNIFLNSLRKNLNKTITQEEAIEMLSQHMLTKPIFDALFSGFEFSKNNSISQSMEKLIKVFDNQAEAETKELKESYASIKKRIEGIDNLAGKQKIIKELYEKVFKEGFPKLAQKLGIVYTPIEVVDFILKSSDDLLKQEFGQGLTDKDVHVLDPFSGTGTFLTRLIESNLITKKDLDRKYKKELHANELVLLAYYITTINIESAYHFKNKSASYKQFIGAVFTDTFQEHKDKQNFNKESYFKHNLKQIKKQKQLPIRVIVGNPPYSAGQKSANDNNKNLKYKLLDDKIKTTYVRNSNATACNNLYDSYIRAIRWSTDKVGKKGLVSFVTNGSFINANNMEGLRCHLAKDFTSLYIFNLRGNQRTSGEKSRREGGKIFGAGSRSTIAISFLVKNPDKTNCTINYYDIGDYLNRDQKLKTIKKLQSISSIKWKQIIPNKFYDWINQRDESYNNFMPMGNRKHHESSLFTMFSNGVVSSRDAWVYNFTKKTVEDNMIQTIDFYNQELNRYKKTVENNTKKTIGNFLNNDSKKISWSRALKNKLCKKDTLFYQPELIRESIYRPFCKQFLYYSKDLNESRGQIYKIFPTANTKNLAICISGVGSNNELSVLMVDVTPNYDLVSNTQCFSRYYYEGTKKIDNISTQIVQKFKKSYKDKTITSEDIFYYIYGLLSSKDYQQKFSSNFGKMLPRIPLCEGFWEFSKTGKKLSNLHVNYEQQEKYSSLDISGLDKKDFRVSKMKFESKTNKSCIVYNTNIKIENIPEEAYQYQVNNKSAIEWIMDRYQVTTNKKNNIKNDPNSSENPKYIIDLLQKVITVSVESVKLINKLPTFKEITIAQEKELIGAIERTKVTVDQEKELRGAIERTEVTVDQEKELIDAIERTKVTTPEKRKKPKTA